ncbi:gustatory and odorant receptor 63a-like [Thrips palmi]|uniref:Gustatory receptor n=1 Tax=Thrips palmi TaxID=161013 RepID=A0A6P8ZBH4_THRPL|nr:gustatory and odorant receptor 63a-like [Thrips palmi]
MVMSFAAAQHRARDEEQDFDGTIIKYLVYIQCGVPVVLLPLYALQRVRLTEYLHDWNKFQAEFARRSGRALSTLRPFSSRDSLEMLAVVVLWEAVVASCQLPLHPPVVVLALVLSNVLAALLASLWYLHGRLLRAAAHASAAHLARVLSRSAPRPGSVAAQVDACRLQTLRLMSLSTALGSAMTLCLGFLLLAHFVLLTLTLYALFGQLSHSTRSAARLPSLVAGVVFSGAVLYVVCDSGHRVGRALKTGAMQEMMAFRKRTPLVGEDLHNMIEAFVATVQEVPSDVSLSGITVVNRQLFTAVLSTMVTYLVVVVQFRVSLEAEDGDGRAALPD